MKNFLPWLFFLLSLSGTKAQTFADWWYFGINAGINFTPAGPVAVLDGELISVEGCASISDAFGNLLFYTRGDSVWDASHNIMLNGSGLAGNGPGGDAAMNSYIVPRPNNPNEYYLFTIRSFWGGLSYSKIDMTLNGGLGGVVAAEKNIPLVDTTLEMVTCLRKPNNLDFWVVCLAKPGDTAFAFEVTSAGVNTTPVLSNTGLTIQTEDVLGYMKGSQQNDRIALTIWKGFAVQPNATGIHLFDFDNASGQMSYDLTITPSLADTFNYGVEFSPNGQLLYVQSLFYPDLRQYDLSSGVAATINASEELIGPSYTGSAGGALQLGPDGKIYVARNSNQFLAAVNFPNSPGLLCGYDHDAVSLSGRTCNYGLPQFYPFFIEGQVVSTNSCFGDTSFFVSNYLSSDSVFWSFGDPSSGTADTSTAVNASHVFTAPGVYTVTHVAFSAFLSDTTILQVTVLPRQSFTLPADTILCAGQSFVLDAGQPGALSFQWNDGSTDSTFLVLDSGLVTLDLIGVCDTINASMQVLFLTPFALDLGPDTLVCDDSSLVLGANLPVGYEATWSTGVSADFIEVSATATYIAIVTSTCDTLIDSIVVSFAPTPEDSLLPADTVLCTNTSFAVSHANVNGINYLWYDSIDSPSISVDTTTLIWLTAANGCGFSSDTLEVTYNGEITTDLGEDTVICVDDSIWLYGTDPLATYRWNTGEETDSIFTERGRTATYVVTVTLKECDLVDAIRVTANDTACPDLDCDLKYGNVFTPNADGINDRFIITSECEIYKFEMAVYNRWGQLVHASNNIAHGWDGTINGVEAPAGTYFFTVLYKDFVVVNADRFATQGSFVLIR